LAVALLFWRLHLPSSISVSEAFWYDELWTMALAAPSVSQSESIAIIRADVHPPLYFLAVRAWPNSLMDRVKHWRAFNLLPFAFALGMAVSALRKQQEKGDCALELFPTVFMYRDSCMRDSVNSNLGETPC
jgi:uncharacterized membrane protein